MLVCPSTLMQLNVAVRGSARDGRQILRPHGRVGQHKGQHRRHVRADHRRSLGEPRQPDFTCTARQIQCAGADLDACIGGEDGAGCPLEGHGVAGKPADGVANARLDALHRQQPANNAGGAHEHLLSPATKRLGGDSRHAPAVIESALASAGVGVARADDDAFDVVGRQPLPANLHGRRTNAVLRENPRRRRGDIADHDGKVEPLRIGPNTTVDAGESVMASEDWRVHGCIQSFPA